MNKNKCEACKERKERIYICSPLWPKAQEPERAEIELKDNLERAKAACRLVAKLGAVPLCSHLFCTQFLDDAVADERKIGRRIGLELLKDADIEIGIPLCGVQDAMEAVKKLLEVIFGDGMTGTDKKGENGNE